MIYLDAVWMALGLAMDATAVSMANGMNEPKMRLRRLFLIAAVFGVFQGVMPLIGYFAGGLLSAWLIDAIPYIGLALLSLLGIKMIVDGVRKKEESPALTIGALLVQALATSIDALTVGVLYIGESVGTAAICFGIIAAVTFVLSVAGVFLGQKCGTKLASKAQIVGGVILIAIGVKILLTALLG